jgi:glycerophosphoryl diester phosphodiesterase
MKTNLKYSQFFTLNILILLLPVFLIAQDLKNITDFRKPNNKIYVIAHRGAHQGIPENSLPAYQKAIDLGCDFVEIDVRTTKDRKFVSVHNSTIDSYVQGQKGRVKEMTLAELKSLDIGEKLGDEWKNTRIPTFEEILQLCKGNIGIYLDLKDAPIPELMKIIRKYDMENDVIWYIPYQYLMDIEHIDQLFGNSFPMPDPGEEKNIKTIFEKIKTPVIATDMGELTLSFVETAHKYGAKVFVDEKEGTIVEWEKIIGWGTDGIQTDKPAELIAFLKRN